MQEKVGSISRSSSIKYVPNSPDQLGNCSILPPIFTHSKKKGFNPVKYFNRGVSAAESWSPLLNREGCKCRVLCITFIQLFVCTFGWDWVIILLPQGGGPVYKITYECNMFI